MSHVDALALLIDFLSIAAPRTQQEVKLIEKYQNDNSGEETVTILKSSLRVLTRITGNGTSSLGLHPAVYFYNEKGKV